jgi:2-dehydro-3-deoxyphosphooctonate aldolase (KDO 8-P synthase)
MSPSHPSPVHLTDTITLGGDRLVVFAGPCAIESEDLVMSVAEDVKKMGEDLDIDVIFKSSYDKANRTSVGGFRSSGLEEGMRILGRVNKELGLPTITDVHETHQIPIVAEVVDVLQIPAFLCRQTDLLIAAGQSGRAINIKRGQFMAARDMRFAVEKVRHAGGENVFLTERGVSFGYHDLVVDMRSFPIMREFTPVVYDVTHSIQQPGANDGSSGGARWLAAPLARGAVAVGVDGLFFETHPDPDNALSDGPNMIPTAELPNVLRKLKQIWEISR